MLFMTDLGSFELVWSGILQNIPQTSCIQCIFLMMRLRLWVFGENIIEVKGPHSLRASHHIRKDIIFTRNITRGSVLLG